MKNLIYNLNSLHDFQDYGIDIPLLNTRVQSTLEYLKDKINLIESEYPNISKEDLALAHNEDFIKKVLNNPDDVVLETYELVDNKGNYNRYNPNLRKKPLNDFVKKAKLHIAGTYLTCEMALKYKFAYHLGGGMHHAMSFKPGGFCMFNDLVISLRKLQKEKKIKQAIIIDLDCHKGDGSAEILKKDPTITTLSIHMKNGWPLDAEGVLKDGSVNPSFIPSDYDIPIDEKDDYLHNLKTKLEEIDFSLYDLALVVHGADVYEKDILESSSGIKLSKDEVLERDLLVYRLLSESKIPQAWCLGGGYGPNTFEIYVQFLKISLSKYM